MKKPTEPEFNALKGLIIFLLIIPAILLMYQASLVVSLLILMAWAAISLIILFVA